MPGGVLFDDGGVGFQGHYPRRHLHPLTDGADDLRVARREFLLRLAIQKLHSRRREPNGHSDFGFHVSPFTNLVTLPFTILVRKSLVGFFTVSVFKAAMAKQSDYVRYTIRVPVDIYEHVARRADENGRSINAEITERLKTVQEMDAYVPGPNVQTDETALELARALVQRLEQERGG